MSDEFAFVTEMSIRYRDLDPWNHVNNAVYATYLEQARVEYLGSVLDDAVGSQAFVLVHLDLDFVDSIEYEDDVSVPLRVADLGTSSLTFEYEVRANGSVAAAGTSTQVHMGPDGSPTPLPDDWRETLRGFEPALD